MINLIQISDPHFGKQFANVEACLVSGFNPHDMILAEALSQCLDDHLRDIAGLSDNDEFFLIMNGDLTSIGVTEEFDVANTFLFSRHTILRKQKSQQIGLSHNLKQYVGIPGNHDHWNGAWFPAFQSGYTREVYESFYDSPPFATSLCCSDGIQLCIFTIDSCSMFAEAMFNVSLSAGGGFSQDHKEAFEAVLTSELNKPLPEGCYFRTALILCHHPFSKDGNAGPLRPACVFWLRQLAAKHGIRFVLTGHTHTSWNVAITVHSDSGDHALREVRCPTTLQTPARLDKWSRSPGLWLHQIMVEGHEIVWKGTLLVFAGGKFRVPVEDASDAEAQRIAWFEERMPSIANRLSG